MCNVPIESNALRSRLARAVQGKDHHYFGHLRGSTTAPLLARGYQLRAPVCSVAPWPPDSSQRTFNPPPLGSFQDQMTGCANRTPGAGM